MDDGQPSTKSLGIGTSKAKKGKVAKKSTGSGEDKWP